RGAPSDRSDTSAGGPRRFAKCPPEPACVLSWSGPFEYGDRLRSAPGGGPAFGAVRCEAPYLAGGAARGAAPPPAGGATRSEALAARGATVNPAGRTAMRGPRCAAVSRVIPL